MDNNIQILSLLFSLGFGIVFYFTSLLNYKIICKCKTIYKYIITFIYMLDIALIYVSLSYKINRGNIHPYFILMVFLGFYVGINLRKLLIKNVKFYDFVARRKQK